MAPTVSLEESRADSEASSSRDESPIFVEQEFNEDAPEEDHDNSPALEDQDTPSREDAGTPIRAGKDRSPENANSHSEAGQTGEDTPHESEQEKGDQHNESDSSDEDEAAVKISVTCHACQHLTRRVQTLQRRLDDKDRVIEKKNHKIEQLQERIRVLLVGEPNDNDDGPRVRGQRRSSKRQWPAMLRDFASGTAVFSYTDVWRRSNMEENMSVGLRNVHPNVQLVAPDEDEGSPHGGLRATSSVRTRTKFERFNDLPIQVQLRIFRFLLKMNGCLIHVFSRLDPHNEAEPDPRPRSRSGLPAKFFISDVSNGRAPVSLSKAIDPAELLRPLLTCKRWCFYLCHVFYGENTFAASSLGEFERFMNGIGPARVQRIQNLELNWIGGVYQPRFPAESQQGTKHRNLHTFPLIWLREACRLRTVVVWVNETAKKVIRRPWEPEEHKLDMKGKTAGQPNARMTRSLRSLLGLDYLYCCRGLFWCRFYNSDLMATTEMRSESKIRDQSFQQDIDRVVCMEKMPAQAKKTELYRLDELFARGG